MANTDGVDPDPTSKAKTGYGSPFVPGSGSDLISTQYNSLLDRSGSDPRKTPGPGSVTLLLEELKLLNIKQKYQNIERYEKIKYAKIFLIPQCYIHRHDLTKIIFKGVFTLRQEIL